MKLQKGSLLVVVALLIPFLYFVVIFSIPLPKPTTDSDSPLIKTLLEVDAENALPANSGWVEDMKRQRGRAAANFRRGASKVLYVHVHKAGGTTLCELARFNGLRSNYLKNCLWDNVHDPVGKQLNDYLESDLNFISLEDRYLPTYIPPPGELTYILTFRHPLDRVLSHFHHDRLDGRFLNVTFPEFVSMDSPVWWSTNHYTKILGGCDNEPCTRKHLDKAKKRLHYFSLIMITDDPDAYDMGAILLRTRLGWRRYKVNKHRQGTSAFSDALSEMEGYPEEFEVFVRRNQLDLELYEYAKHLAYTDLMEEALNPEVQVPARDRPAQLLRVLSRMYSSRTGLDPLIPDVLHPEWKGLAGSGGHDSICRSYGHSNLKKCQRLLLASKDCGALTLKGGECYLHNLKDKAFHVVENPGSTFQIYYRYMWNFTHSGMSLVSPPS